MLWGLVDNGMLQREKYYNINLLINRAIITMSMVWGLVDNGLLQRAKYYKITLLINRAIITMIFYNLQVHCQNGLWHSVQICSTNTTAFHP